MMRTIKDLKSKTSSMESDGVYIMPFNPKYEKDELEERMLKVVEEQPSVALRFLCLIGDYKVGTSKQYISQIFLQSCLTAFPWERTSSPLPIKNLLRQRISIKAKNTSSYLTKSIVCWKMLISQCTQRKSFGI